MNYVIKFKIKKLTQYHMQLLEVKTSLSSHGGIIPSQMN
uniref:Uncharacterized protein n=1 Tax=Lepeophtheirus salmonis TaxID=72036 RepID=A0A0K2TDJ4_LEPSM